jgi:hypothetical protein
VPDLHSSISQPIQLSQTVQRFWQFLVGYSLAAIGVSLLHGFLFGWRVGGVALGVAVLLLVVILAIGQPLFVPYRVQPWQVEPVTITAGWPAHDWCELDRLTAEMAELGFVQLQDYAQPQRTGKFQLIVRCFGNASIGSFAEIGFCLVNHAATEPSLDDAVSAIVTVPQPLITHTVFFSRFDQGWMLIDGNFTPNRRESLIYAWRNPREVRHYYPEMGPTVLADRHLGNRQAMIRRLDITAHKNISWDTYREIQQELISQPWRRLRRRNLLIAMLEATRYERQPAHAWLGEYRQVLRQDRRIEQRLEQ